MIDLPPVALPILLPALAPVAAGARATASFGQTLHAFLDAGDATADPAPPSMDEGRQALADDGKVAPAATVDTPEPRPLIAWLPGFAHAVSSPTPVTAAILRNLPLAPVASAAMASPLPFASPAASAASALPLPAAAPAVSIATAPPLPPARPVAIVPDAAGPSVATTAALPLVELKTDSQLGAVADPPGPVTVAADPVATADPMPGAASRDPDTQPDRPLVATGTATRAVRIPPRDAPDPQLPVGGRRIDLHDLPSREAPGPQLAPAAGPAAASIGSAIDAARPTIAPSPSGPSPTAPPAKITQDPVATATPDASGPSRIPRPLAANAQSDAGHVPRAAPPIAVSTTPQPARNVFAAAIAAASGWRERVGKRDATESIELAPRLPGAIEPPSVTATDAAHDTPLDLRGDRGLQQAIDRIETLRDDLRDGADTTDTRIRLVPDKLGAVDIAVRRDGDDVHVHFTAERAETQALLVDAQPRLTVLAAERGVRIAETSVSAGTSSPDGSSQSRAQTPQPRPTFRAPASAEAADTPTETRLA